MSVKPFLAATLPVVALLALAGNARAQAGAADAPLPVAAPAAAPIDPARLAVAERVVGKLVPPGIYQDMFAKALGPMMEQMVGSVGELPMGQLARIGGITEDQAKALGNVKMREIMEILDPVWKERQLRMMRAMTEGMGGVMARIEPSARAALARAYAREFSVAELEDLDRYFATATGAHYAGRSLSIAMDPEMMKAMNEMMPVMMAELPNMLKKAEEATKDLPPRRKPADLSPAERKKLGELFGVDPETFEDAS